MRQFEFYSLKDLLEDFYISEIATELAIDESLIDYTDNLKIEVQGEKLETLLSANNLSKKKVFKNAEGRVLSYLRTFSCSRNPDVEDYLYNSEKALRLQKESVSRTYLIIDSEDEGAIVAYFSISIKPVTIKDSYEITKTKLRKMNVKRINDDIEVCTTFLIGQIGRNDSYTREDIDLRGILEYVFAVINKVRELIGGKIILIEVEKEPKLIKRYEELSFENIQSDSENTQLMQWVNTY